MIDDKAMTQENVTVPVYRQFACQACGYVYDEALGSPKDNLPAGTRFVQMNDTWQCPLCGAPKHEFEPLGHAPSSLATQAECPSHGVVVIGAGLAGWSMVDAIRALDKAVRITLISADDADRYHKPMLSVAISQNKTPSDLVRATGTKSAMDLDVKLLANTKVTSIDGQAKVVQTAQGVVAYDKLVLAIGANPIYPPMIDSRHVAHINHLHAFAKLQQRLGTGSKNVAIIGAGMVGTEFAEDLIKAGHQVSLIDRHDCPLASLLPSVVGARILSALQNLGLTWLGGSRLDDVGRCEQGYRLCLTKDSVQSQLLFDEVVVATGLMVDGALPTSAGLIFDERAGIVVDPQTLQTSQADIYALGDCIGIDGVACRYVAVHRPQAATIAHQILNRPHTGYAHQAPMIRLKNKCVSVSANGNPKADGDWQVITDNDNELVLQMVSADKIVAKVVLKIGQ